MRRSRSTRRLLAGPRARLLVRFTTVASLLVGLGGAAGCGGATGARWALPSGRATSPPSAPPGGRAMAPPSAPASEDSPSAGKAPATAFAVGVRQLSLSRAADRPLPTTVWYPSAGTAGGAARSGAAVAPGRFPLVLFSHGLTATPASYAGVGLALAAAGFVVAAPTYPYTSGGAAQLRITDLPNQPADAFFVIAEVLRLDTTAGDPLAGHLDTARVAAMGHSAGGFTTAGMLAAQRDARLRAAVVIAGGSMGAFVPPSTSVLFVHGDGDQTVAYSSGRAAYERLTWPRAFLTVVGGDHGGYLTAGRPGSDQVRATVIDFLRTTLYGDPAARGRLLTDGTGPNTRYEQQPAAR